MRFADISDVHGNGLALVAVLNGEVFLCHGTPASGDAAWAAARQAIEHGFPAWTDALTTGWGDGTGLF